MVLILKRIMHHLISKKLHNVFSKLKGEISPRLQILDYVKLQRIFRLLLKEKGRILILLFMIMVKDNILSILKEPSFIGQGKTRLK